MPDPLPTKYVPAEHEPAVSARWDAAKAFHADPGRVRRGEAEPYTILIPPPNVTAALHLGHALNNTLQDILVRAHRMQGFEALWMPGTDHAGIATQTVVDRRLKAEGQPSLADYKRIEAEHGNGRELFIAKVQAWKDEYEATITGQLKAMGCSCDWDRQRFTMDPVCARAVREAFFRFFRDGLIYRGKRLVNWDPVTQTALADDEVEMVEVDSFFWYLRYPLTDKAGTPTGEFVTVATTRPETYFGDTAVAVNPQDPARAHLIGRWVQLPFVGRVIPIIGDDYVVMPDPESSDAKAKFASGFLKVTPAHDTNDYEIGQRHNLISINVMAPDASLSDRHGWSDVGDAGWVLGLSREEARKAVEQRFREAGLLADKKPYTHAVGHSYRSHAAIEPYLSDQWYVRVTDDRLRGTALRAMTPEQSTHPLTSGTGFQPVSPSLPPTLNKRTRNLPHWELGGSTYFVTFRTMTTQLTPQERDTVLDACYYWHGSRCTVHIALVMPDHVHLILTPNKQDENTWWQLSGIMHSIKSFTANAINTARGSSGPLWQDEYYDRIVRDEDEFTEKWNYILNNPVAAGLTRSLDEYRHLRRSEEHGLEARATLEASATRLGVPHDGRLRFYPDRYAKTFEAWHENLRDWCISRQLWWGHRIPVWSGPAEALRTFTLDPADAAVWIDDRTAHVCVRSADPTLERTLESVGLTRDPDVLDTWFSSALWPLSTLGWPDGAAAAKDTQLDDFPDMLPAFNPTAALLTAREIITLWVSRMVMFNRYLLSPPPPLGGTGVPPVSAPSLSDGRDARPTGTRPTSATPTITTPTITTPTSSDAEGPVPFHDVFIHAMIQDGEGRKMSKSLGNGVDPRDIIQSHGADAMRFTLCEMTTQTQDVRLPVEPDPATGANTSPKFDKGRNFCTKLFNATKFVCMMLDEHRGGEPATVGPDRLQPIDRWIIARIAAATARIDTALAQYEFSVIGSTLYELLWKDFCDWYLEGVKPTIKTSPAQRVVLQQTLEAIVRLLHPVAPFITEVLYEQLRSRRRGSIDGLALPPGRSDVLCCSTGWPVAEASCADPSAVAAFERLQALVDAIRQVRAQHQVPPRRRITLHAAAETIHELSGFGPVLETLAGLGAVTSAPPPAASVVFMLEGAELHLSDLADALDHAAERERLEKLIESLTQSLAALDKRLANPGYTEKAPRHLVDETRAQRDRHATDLEGARRQLAGLA